MSQIAKEDILKMINLTHAKLVTIDAKPVMTLPSQIATHVIRLIYSMTQLAMKHVLMVHKEIQSQQI